MLRSDHGASPPRQIIVIVDDRLTNLTILERLARSLGDTVEVETFDRPLDALASAERRTPDLLVTDLQKCPISTGSS